MHAALYAHVLDAGRQKTVLYGVERMIMPSAASLADNLAGEAGLGTAKAGKQSVSPPLLFRTCVYALPPPEKKSTFASTPE